MKLNKLALDNLRAVFVEYCDYYQQDTLSLEEVLHVLGSYNFNDKELDNCIALTVGEVRNFEQCIDMLCDHIEQSEHRLTDVVLSGLEMSDKLFNKLARRKGLLD